MIDVVVPTVSGREDSYERFVESVERNSSVRVNFITIRDEETCGRAWMLGLKLSTSPYVLLACDDLEMTSPAWSEVCCETVDKGMLPCPIVKRPDGGIESCGGDMHVAHCLIGHMQDDWTPCDFTVVPFYNREQAERIGMIPGHYKTDVYASHKGRELGYETVVRHGYEFIHHHSDVKRLAPSRQDDEAYSAGMSG